MDSTQFQKGMGISRGATAESSTLYDERVGANDSLLRIDSSYDGDVVKKFDGTKKRIPRKQPTYIPASIKLQGKGGQQSKVASVSPTSNRIQESEKTKSIIAKGHQSISFGKSGTIPAKVSTDIQNPKGTETDDKNKDFWETLFDSYKVKQISMFD